MENKLQELTQKLYTEGLSKGRDEADTLVAKAKAEAEEILAKAKAEAEKIMSQAQKTAEETAKNTATEIALASRQSVATLKEAISSMVVSNAISSSVATACVDAAFVKELLLTVAKSWNGVGAEKADLLALLPEGKKAEFEKVFASSAKSLLDAGVQVSYSSGVKSGFKIEPKDGGYYISFTDADFEALLSEFLRAKVAKILFEK
ncbi:MAG: hypothetical protein R3Y38_02210 [Rikenellaceae bacterium]